MSAPAYRIAPRRAGARRSGSRIDWDRLGRIALVLVLFVILALYVRPLVGAFQAWHSAGAESAELAELKRENAKLRARAATLADPEAAERGARAIGMVAPDERSVLIEPRD